MKSILKPGSSRRRRRNLQANAKPHVRPEPPPPNKAEQRILDLLWRGYRRMRAVAKAAARFEADVHETFVQERIDEGYDAADAGNVERVFSADDFVLGFRPLLQLHMDRQLLHLLALDDYEQDIMRERIKDLLARRETPPPPVKARRVQVGDAEIQQLQHIKSLIDHRRGK